MNNSKNVKSIRPSNARTEVQLTELERDAVRKLAQALPVWHQQLGPGLDYVFAGLTALAVAADCAAAAAEATRASMLEVRAAGTNAILEHLAVPKFEQARRQRSARVRCLGGAKKTALQMAYENKTLTLLTQDFEAWYNEAGLGGFIGSLVELTDVYGEIFHTNMDDESLGRDKVFFLSAFELRHRFGKVPQEMLEAIELVGKAHAREAAAA